jgi:phosphatidylserine decarboxylase
MILIHRVLHHTSSRIVGWVASAKAPQFLVQRLIRWFASTYKINLDEATQPLSEYSSLGAFFTREIRSECRPISSATVVSPTDGEVISAGYVSDGMMVQVKGRTYSVASLLGGSRTNYQSFATIYLSPKDCHRIFSPVQGQIVSTRLIPGCLYPVRQKQLRAIPHLYCKNERLVSIISVTGGHQVALVAVGALNVGSMSTTFDRDLLPVSINPGDWIKTFHLGSTVVILDTRKLTLPALGPIQYGETLFE